MKGGGIVLLVIFVFFFICFVWGVASVVGNARNAIQFKRAPEKNDVSEYPKYLLNKEPISHTPPYIKDANNVYRSISDNHQTITNTL